MIELNKKLYNHIMNYIILRIYFISILIRIKWCKEIEGTSYTSSIKVYSLLSSKDFIMGFISIYSFMRNSELKTDIRIINDGSLTQKQFTLLKLLGVKVLSDTHSKLINKSLNLYPETSQLYKRFILMKKLIDVRLDGNDDDTIIYLDSDVLFNKKCQNFDRIVKECASNSNNLIYFNKDIDFSFISSANNIEKAFKINQLQMINSGLIIMKRNIIDLEKIEEILSNKIFMSWTENRFWVTEQTIYAMLAAQNGVKCNVLPEIFDVSIPANLSNEAMHFVGKIRKTYYQGLLC